MKIIALLVLALGLTFSGNAQNNYGTPPVSKISTELNKKQVTHSTDSWLLESTKGVNKMELFVEAVKYSAVNSTDVFKGIRIKLVPENTSSETEFIKSLTLFEAYIDDTEYSEVMVVINKMVTDFSKRNPAKRYGNMTYTTKGDIKFGFIFTESKQIGYISILYGQTEISCEFSSIEKFFTTFLNDIDIASKDLYLPENAEKLKNAKKGNQQVKDVIIDDI